MPRLTPLLLLVALAACSTEKPEKAPEPANGRPLVLASFEPLRWLTHELAGDLVELRVLTPEGADPLHYKPDEKATLLLQRADLIVLNGAGAESWTGKVSLPLSKLVDASEVFASEFIEIEGAITHKHGPGEEHTHAGLDPHVWLDPENLRRQAKTIHARLGTLLPKKREALDAALARLNQALDTLDQQFRALGEQPEGQVFVASHPAYNYVARRYGWKMLNLDIDPQEMPNEEFFARLGQQLRGKNARFVFWESSPKTEIAQKFRELGLESVLVAPGELLSADELKQGEDFATVMRANLERLGPVFAGR